MYINNIKNSFLAVYACAQARTIFEKIRVDFERLAKIIPDKQYYRYNDMWRHLIQRLCFLAALIVYLEVGVLINKKTAAEIIGGIVKTVCIYIFVLKRTEIMRIRHTQMEN